MTSDNMPLSKTRSVPTWWRALTVLLALVLLLGWAASASMTEQLKAQIKHTQTQLSEVSQVRYVSILLDEQQMPAMLVTLDPNHGNLLIQRLNEVKEGREDTMQLWALEDGQPARSLGTIQSKFKTMEIPVQQNALTHATQLALSVEAKGGVPEVNGPRLPYLFKGWLVQKSI